jgi:hypothetical protein
MRRDARTRHSYLLRMIDESKIHISVDERSINIQTSNMDDMFIELEDSGNGKWGYRHADGDAQIGLAVIPNK